MSIHFLHNYNKINYIILFHFSGALRLKKKMLFPLLIGVTLKFVSLIPIILGKLAFIGSMAIMASKLSLILTGVIGLKKLLKDADGGLSQQGQYYHDGQYMYFGGDGQNPTRGRRMLFVGGKLGTKKNGLHWSWMKEDP
jgi:hypothetical protein